MAQQQRIGARWLEAVRKAFRLGPAVVSPYGDTASFIESGWQRDSIPKEKWQELSVAVYSCTRLRAQTLAGVPHP